MDITPYITKVTSLVPKTLTVWVFLIFIFLLSMPIIISVVLMICLKKFSFRFRPVSPLCYSNVRLIIPVIEFITFVVTVRYISVSLHFSKPFITFRIRGVKFHIIQYSVFKDKNITQYVNDLKTRFLMGINEKRFFNSSSVKKKESKKES